MHIYIYAFTYEKISLVNKITLFINILLYYSFNKFIPSDDPFTSSRHFNSTIQFGYMAPPQGLSTLKSK